MNIKTVVKSGIKICFGLLILLLLIVCVFIGINIKDKSPSATAIEFQQAWDNRQAVSDVDNGYIYFLGFDVEEKYDPALIGLERIQWSKDILQQKSQESLRFPQATYHLQQQVPQFINQLLDRCIQINQHCIDEIEKQKNAIVAWQTPDQWFEKRYQTLIGYKSWLELSALDMRLPFANYSEVIKAQRLMFIRTFAAARAGDIAGFKTFADQDLRFWRTMLANTDLLISKMVAIAAIKNNFVWTNLFLRGVAVVDLERATPGLLKQPFTATELSLQRSLVGEWVFASNTFDPDALLSQKPMERFVQKLLLKKQDTMNQMAANHKSLLNELDVPVDEFESAWLAQQQPKQKKPVKPAILYYLSNPYNPVGRILIDVAEPAYGGYVARLKNLEVFRLGMLAAIAKMHDPENETLQFVSPYTTKPFVLDEMQRSVTVKGFGKGNNGQEVYFY